MKKIPITFRKRMILYNLLIIICVAFTISIYTYSSYKLKLRTRISAYAP